MKRILPAVLALMLSMLAPLSAQADETWDSDMGQIVYFDEQSGAAIFTFTNLDAYPAKLIIPGLAGNYNNRSTHEAFWIGEGAGMCDAFLSTSDGSESSQWGRALISFDRPNFPTGFTLLMGDCFEPLRHSIRANLP